MMTTRPARRLFSLSAGVVGLFAGCAAQGPESSVSDLGSMRVVRDVRANAFTSSTQENVSIDADDRGNVIAAWDSRRQKDGQYGVYAVRLNGAGQPLTPEVALSDSIRGGQFEPAVAVDSSGGAWFAWTTFGDDGDAGGIVARRFDADLLPLSAQIPVNAAVAGHQSEPAIAAGFEGRAMIVWTTPHSDGRTTRVVGRLVAQDGACSGEIALAGSADSLSGSDSLATIATHADGGFIVAWARSDADGARSAILARRFDDEGCAISGEVVVSDAVMASNIEPSVATDALGRCVVAWMAGSADGYRAAVRILDASGAPVGDVRLVTPADGSWVSGVGVAVARDGRHIATWNRLNPGTMDDIDVHAQEFRANGEAAGEPFRVNRRQDGRQQLQIASNAKRVAWSSSDQIAIGWTGDAGLGDDVGANVTVLSPVGLAVEPVDAAWLARVETRSLIAPIPPIWDPNFKPLGPPAIDLNPGADFGFLGVNNTGWTPPDPEIAAGPDHLVQMTNGAIAFFDQAGNNLFQDEIEGAQGFWGAQGAGGFVFDPESLYDPHSGRFFAMACERTGGRSYYLLAVSDDGNPVGNWHKYRIDVTNVDTDIDSPNMGIDQNVVYLTADFFGPDKYQVLMIEKAPILSGGAINSRQFTMTGASEQSMGIPITFDQNAPAQYIIQSAETGTPNGITFSEVRFHAVRDPLGAPTRVTFDLAVPTYSYPNQPPQQGTTNRPFLFEPRFWSCMYVNGSLWAVHHVNGSRCRARWYEFRMNGWPTSGSNPTLRQSGELDYGGTVHTFFPSIAANAQGDAVIFFARSATNEFISIGRAFRRGSDALNTFRPMEFVKQSTSPYSGANRWGDYSHVEPEPDAPGSFWGTHEWTDTANGWRTWIARVETGGFVPTTLTGFTIERGSLVSGVLNDLRDSDNARVRTLSGFGSAITDLHLLRMVVTADGDMPDPSAIRLTIEARIDEPAGTVRVFLRNWDTTQFVQVGTHAIGNTEVAQVINVPTAAAYANASGNIEMQIRHIVVAPVFAFTFESFFDQVRVEVE